MDFQVIDWLGDAGVRLLDQTRLPREEVYLEVRSIDQMVEAIRALRVRGAPLIGIGAAMALAAGATQEADQGSLSLDWIEGAADRLEAARPTGVNLQWAVARMRRVAVEAFGAGGAQRRVAELLRQEAQRIWDEDVAMCRAIGEAGAGLIEAGATVLTHCNAGALATGGIGTALAAIYVAHEQGKGIQVVATETRPLRQGARLTAWELVKVGVPVRAVADSAAASVMAGGSVDLVITGADRITANGDVANKIGTYSLALLAKAHAIPFYVAAPCSTFDPALASGERIPIEQRAPGELDVAPGAEVYNPAFDVTPAWLVTALVTDRGVIEPPFDEGIRALFD
ncbi:MAG: S-methyl-5-thioribose-1-phosphate isomerase [Gemmatimonadales bacterium]|nr:S-methyl-5-thioribose-1-phosphate isomerase [Gemmatimonadales bacterium]NIN48664.1 S-methyl-5-thioribose-1-phosphate isomerase [Gemmatimonadales bacterium]NIP06128.1 S-methyl-5-thioribose-1-phosphate isomerase [Gemmatimonadales bacterium]NIR01302.1 S-methyl-5-thioribose-1-phosphate isomerase [Gemmatimonadales bacterium]